MIELKPCPVCYGRAYQGCDRAWCINTRCRVDGPTNDPDGTKWDAMPRRDDVAAVVPVVEQPRLIQIIPTGHRTEFGLGSDGSVWYRGPDGRWVEEPTPYTQDAPLTRAEEYEEDNKRA